MVLNLVRREVRLLRCLNLFQQRRLLGNSAEHNEYYKLELLGAWEPLDNLYLGRGGEQRRARYSFSYGD